MSGRFLFLSPNTRTPAGGVQKIYEFAGALVRANYDAWVVHNSPGFVPWFDHAVTVTTEGPFGLLTMTWLWYQNSKRAYCR